MIKKMWHFDLEPNMGRIDRYARYTLSIALIGSMLLVPQTGWDPVYALMQKQRTPKFRFFAKKPAA